MKLSELEVGRRAIVQGITNHDAKEKLMEMGCLPGEQIIIENAAPFGGPLAVGVLDYKFSLRRSDAEFVIVQPL